MTKEEYLSQAAVVGRQIAKLETNIGYYRELACSPTSSAPSGDRVSKSRSTAAPFESMVLKIVELEQRLDALKEKRDKLCAEIMMTIESLENEDHKAVLVLRYLQDLEWGLVAAKVNASIATVYRWHRAALQKLIVPDSR